MSKRQLLCLLGVWIMFFLFLGLPSGWHKTIGLISGLLVIIVAYNLPAAPQGNTASRTQNTFEENKQQ